MDGIVAQPQPDWFRNILLYHSLYFLNNKKIRKYEKQDQKNPRIFGAVSILNCSNVESIESSEVVHSDAWVATHTDTRPTGTSFGFGTSSHEAGRHPIYGLVTHGWTEQFERASVPNIHSVSGVVPQCHARPPWCLYCESRDGTSMWLSPRSEHGIRG
jgi:hypothetical protein